MIGAPRDEDAVRAVVLDHIEGWFDGDAPRVGRALHPEYRAMEKLTAQDMIEATANGQGRDEDAEDRQISIEISYLKGNTARATCVSHRYLEVLQLIRTPEGWKVLNGICQARDNYALLLPGSSEVLQCQSWSPPIPIQQANCGGRMLRRAGQRGRRRR
jgi:hypothetical protein